MYNISIDFNMTYNLVHNLATKANFNCVNARKNKIT